MRNQAEPSLTLVPLEGTVAHTSNKEVEITVTQIKWEKTRSLVPELETLMKEDMVPHKILE